MAAKQSELVVVLCKFVLSIDRFCGDVALYIFMKASILLPIVLEISGGIPGNCIILFLLCLMN